MSFANQEYSGSALATTERDDGRSISVIDQFSTFDGSFVAERDLRIDGIVKGTIVCRGTLFVAEGATVNAHIEAENISVAGELTGDIDCRGRLRILPSGVLKGKVKTKALVIAQGAVYDGDLTMVSAPPPTQVATGAEPTRQEQPAPRPATRAARQESNTGAETTAAPSQPAAPSTFIRRLGGPETPWAEQGPEESSPPVASEE